MLYQSFGFYPQVMKDPFFRVDFGHEIDGIGRRRRLAPIHARRADRRASPDRDIRRAYLDGTGRGPRILLMGSGAVRV